MAKQLEQVLVDMGHQVVYTSRLSADLSTSSSQTPIEVSQFQRRDVEVVLMLAGTTVRGTQFVQTAESQQYKPKYAVSDWGSNFTDSGAAGMPSSFEGSLGITATRNNEFRANRPEPALAVRCRAVYEARSGRQLAERGSNEYGLTMNQCDLIAWFERAAAAAGPGITRPALSSGVQSLGPIESASWGNGSFGPGKLDMNDDVRTIRWTQSCRCWQPVDDFHRGRF